jgi:hypothetical protein
MADSPRIDEGAKLPEWPEQVIGGKYVRLLERQLHQLRREPAHGNRTLRLDDAGGPDRCAIWCRGSCGRSCARVHLP